MGKGSNVQKAKTARDRKLKDMGGGSSGGRATLCVRITEPGESNLSRRVGEEASSRPEDGRGVVGSPNRSADERRASGVCAAIPRRGER